MAVKEVGALDYHEITVQLTDGKKFQTKSCWGKVGDVLTLDIDPSNHPAWRKDNQSFVNTKDDQITKFNKKFSGFKI
ncbi:MAG: 50S ribosomal protein L31 [Rickettsiales bacterium]|jgi:large subunit ribosomal protein L31|nr:50S ribosomal protein L31 [Rickettsiales bacterium]